MSVQPSCASFARVLPTLHGNARFMGSDSDPLLRIARRFFSVIVSRVVDSLPLQIQTLGFFEQRNAASLMRFMSTEQPGTTFARIALVAASSIHSTFLFTLSASIAPVAE